LNVIISKGDVMSSAIELYKEAWDLDFNKGDSLYAETLYRELIERFPHSDEKEYALVHLERIAKRKGNPNDPTFKPLHSGSGGGGLAVVCFFLILLLIVGLGYGYYYGYQQHLRMESNELVIQGLLSERYGEFADAAQKYEQARQVSSLNGSAYRCLALLYLNMGKLPQAENIGKQWQLLIPHDANLRDFSNRLADSIAQQGHP
jgi:tetratricopeptide (TPR) repeat protein